ncbi:MAG: hypothetical protein R8F63_19300 [Acidimicrobiales bacterium]|nr:hypothetical protein [Acidimicrobiales bacterium]
MSRPIFYTHIMKTGGISITTSIRDAVGADRTFPDSAGDVAVVAAKSIPDYLLALDDEDRRALRFTTVHQPAWVAFTAPPDTIRATVLREPVARTLSHLRQIAGGNHRADSPREAWDDPEIRARLSNYMCQLFADREDRPVPNEPLPDEMDDAMKRRVLASLSDGWSTAIWNPMAIDDAALAQAIATLSRFDVVGTTANLAGFVSRLATAAELPLSPPEHLNRTSEPVAVDDDLVDEIRAAVVFDQQLYEHAQASDAAG